MMSATCKANEGKGSHKNRDYKRSVVDDDEREDQ